MGLTFPRDSPYGEEVKAGTQSCQSHSILAGFFSSSSLLSYSSVPHLGNGAAHSGLSPPTPMNDQEDP